MFYLLSLITGILECGWITFGAVNALPLWQILCYPLAYHIGNLFPKPFTLSKNILYLMGILSAVISTATLITALSSTTVFIMTCVSLFCLSAVIQSVRSNIKSDGNRLVKRIFRVGGFALAPLAVIIPSGILIFASVLALYSLNAYNEKSGVSKMHLQNGFSAVMIFHQLHYFFYAHIILAAVTLLCIENYSAVGVIIGEFLFCGTWITYMLVEPTISRLTTKILPVFYAGHIGISILLFVMSLVSNQYIFIFLWLATGLGGGVVYTISAKAKSVGSYNKDSMTISENIGHTFGLLTAVIISAIFGIHSPEIMLVFGSVSALFAVISMMFTLRKGYNYENFTDHS